MPTYAKIRRATISEVTGSRSADPSCPSIDTLRFTTFTSCSPKQHQLPSFHHPTSHSSRADPTAPIITSLARASAPSDPGTIHLERCSIDHPPDRSSKNDQVHREFRVPERAMNWTGADG